MNNNGFFGNSFNFGKAMRQNKTVNNNMGNGSANVNMENGSANVNMENGSVVYNKPLPYKNPIKENRNKGNKRVLNFKNYANVQEFNVPEGSFRFHQGLKNSTSKRFVAQPNNYKNIYSKHISNFQKEYQKYQTQINNMRKVNPNLVITKNFNQNVSETVGNIAAKYETLRNMLGNNRVRVEYKNLNDPSNTNNVRRNKNFTRKRKSVIAAKLRSYYSDFYK